MFYNILKQYIPSLVAQDIIPLDVKEASPDCQLYLCHLDDCTYVVVEADYLSGLPGIAKDIEKAFSVTAIGWCVLAKYRKKAENDLLAPDSEDYDPHGENDANYKNYLYAVYSANNLRYAVLKVQAKNT